MRSDPEASEQMSLGVAGAVDPGETVFIVAGAHGVNLPSENLFLWTNVPVLRDGDAGDYAKLLDPAGNLVSGMNCAGQPVGGAPAAPVPGQSQQQAQAQNQQQATQTTTGTSASAAQGKGPKGVPAAGGLAVEEAGMPWLPMAAGLVAVSVGGLAVGYSFARAPQTGAKRKNRW
jgi:hypothetical protein